MIPDCQQLKEVLRSFSLVVDCDSPSQGVLRIATPFQYLDRSLIDVFLVYDRPLYPNWYLLSDFGQTALQLMHFLVKPWESKKQRQIIGDICESLGVQSTRGELFIGIEEDRLTDKLPGAVVRLAQACIRVGDLYLTARPQVRSTFREDVKAFIGSKFPFEGPFELPGRHGKPVFVDLRVPGRQKASLVQTLSVADEALPHPRSNDIFASWYELQDLKGQNRFITVVEDKAKKAREDDIGRLQDFSEIVYFPREQERLQTILAA